MAGTVTTERLARFSALRAKRVIAAWAVAVVLSIVAASTIGDVLTTSMEMSNDPESARAAALVEAHRGPERPQEFVVVRSERFVADDPEFRRFVRGLVDEVSDLPDVTAVVDYYQVMDGSLISSSGHTVLIPVHLAGRVEDAARAAGPLLAAIEGSEQDGFAVSTVGAGSIAATFNEVSERDLQRGEMMALPVALLVLVAVFGALVAAGTPLVLAFAGIVVAIGITAIIGRAFELSFFVVNMITMIGLAVGIDYALFIVHRVREERRLGADTLDSIARAGGSASRAVAFSGITVVISLTGLFLVPSNVYASLAVGAITVTVCSVAAALTLLPAILALLGDRLEHFTIRAPRLGRREEKAAPGRMTRAVTRHPALAAVASVVLLVAAATPATGLRLGASGVGSLPDSDTRRAFEVLRSEFAAGLIAPVDIVVSGTAEAIEPTTRAVVARLESDPRFGPSTLERSDDGTLAIVSAPLTVEPATEGARDAVRELRRDFARVESPGARILVGGATADTVDYVSTIEESVAPVFGLVLALSFVVLLVAFRSVVVPLKAIIMNLLSVGAAYGLTVLVFQHGLGAEILGFRRTETIEAWLPLFLFAVLFGLSMDYHVFLLSRIKEHFELTGDNSAAILHGLDTTSRLITGAALIMVAVFGGFAMGELVSMQQMGFGLAVAVILDATVVRSVLVPASMQLLGARNWWLPAWLGWLPDLKLEGRRSLQEGRAAS